MSTTPATPSTSSYSSSSTSQRGSYQPASDTRGVFLPILLVLLAFLSWTIFQTTQLISERGNLNQAHTDQATRLDQSYKVRQANDSLAGKTQKLADAGNANAGAEVAKLKQQGITINPNAPTSTPPK